MELAIATTSTRSNTAGRFQNFRAIHNVPIFFGSEITARRKLLEAKLPIAAMFPNNFRHRRLLLCSAAKSPIVLPEPIKEFPWKKAGNVFAHHLLNIGKEALKTSFAAFYITTFASDILLSISQNRGMLIPVGLLVGVILADFFRETIRELLLNTQKEWSDDNRHVVIIGATFAAIKLVVFYQLPWSGFLCHVCNGGLMQVWWLMNNLKAGALRRGSDMNNQ